MKVLYDFTIKNLKENKKRTTVTFIGIALSCSLLFGVGLFASTYRHNLIRETIRENGSHHIEYRDIETSKLDIIQKDYDVKEVLVETTEVAGTITKKDYDTNVEIISLNVNYKDVLDILHGDVPTEDNEIIISEELAREHGIKLLDTININNKRDKLEYKVTGIFKIHNDFQYYYKSRYGAQKIYTNFEVVEDSYVNAYVTLSSTKHSFAKLNLLTTKLEMPFPDIDQYSANAHVTVNTSLLVFDWEIIDLGVFAVLYLSTLLILAVLSLVCILIIYNSFSVAITERKRQLGMLSSVGATPDQILKSVLLEAGLISIIAIPVGFLLSIGVVSIVLTVLNIILKLVIIEPFVISINPFFMLIALTFIVFTIFLSALFPAYRASDVTPLEAIKLNKDIRIKRKKIKTNKLIFKLFGIEGDIAHKFIKRNKKRYRTTTVSLVISIVLFLTVATFIKALHNGGVTVWGSHQNYDAYLGVDDSDKQSEILNKIKSIDSIKNIVLYQEQYLFIEEIKEQFINEEYLIFDQWNISNKRKYIRVISLDDITYQKYKKQIGLTKEQPILVNHGYSTMLNEDNVVVVNGDNKYFHYEGPVFKESDDLTFNFCHYEGDWNFEKITDCYYQLTDFYYTIPNHLIPDNWDPVIVVNQKTYNELYNNNLKDGGKTIHLGLELKNPAKFDEEVKVIFNDYPDMYFGYNNPQLENHKNEMIARAIIFALYSFSAFIALIGITSIINTINTSINLRKVEFAMLRSVGQTPASFNKMIRLESIFLGLKSLIYGLLISFAIIYLLIKISSLSYGDNQIEIPYPITQIIFCIIFVFIIIFLIMKYATNKLKNNNIVETIRKENI